MVKIRFKISAAAALAAIVAAAFAAPLSAEYTPEYISEAFNMSVAKLPTEAEIKEFFSVDEAGHRIYKELLAAEGEEKAIAEAVNYYRSQPIVKEVWVSVSGVTVKYTIGVTGGFLFYRPGKKGGGH